MMSRSLAEPNYRYSQINEESESSTSGNTRGKDRSSIHIPFYQLAVYAVSLVMIAGLGGIWLGRRTISDCRNLQLQRTNTTENFYLGGTTSRTFDYNPTFTLAPSEESDSAWDSLFPKGMGYIHDPLGKYEVVGVSVLHQLHCLDLLRHVYYAAELGVPLTGASHEPVGDHVVHAKHCFDYLRRALMCGADATLEPAIVDSVTGMGVVHTCRDFDGLVAWTEERRLE